MAIRAPVDSEDTVADSAEGAGGGGTSEISTEAATPAANSAASERICWSPNDCIDES
jgi:hypothetical protein